MPQVVLENVIFSYVNVFKPRPNRQGIPKYSACILIDKNNAKAVAAAQQAQKDAIEEGIAAGKWTAAMAPTLKLPLRDGDAELKTEQRTGDEYVGRIFCNANANQDSPPGIVKPVGGQAVPITDPMEFFSGCIGHAYLSFYPFKTPESKGVAVGLNACYKLEEGERLDGRKSATSVFAAFAESEEGTDDLTSEMPKTSKIPDDVDPFS